MKMWASVYQRIMTELPSHLGLYLSLSLVALYLLRSLDEASLTLGQLLYLYTDNLAIAGTVYGTSRCFTVVF